MLQPVSYPKPRIFIGGQVDPELVRRLDRFRAEMQIRSRAEAIREVIDRGVPHYSPEQLSAVVQ